MTSSAAGESNLVLIAFFRGENKQNSFENGILSQTSSTFMPNVMCFVNCLFTNHSRVSDPDGGDATIQLSKKKRCCRKSDQRKTVFPSDDNYSNRTFITTKRNPPTTRSYQNLSQQYRNEEEKRSLSSAIDNDDGERFPTIYRQLLFLIHFLLLRSELLIWQF